MKKFAPRRLKRMGFVVKYQKKTLMRRDEL